MPLTVENGDIERAKLGGAALERLIERIWPEAFGMALHILRDRGLAEDSAQDACAAIARSLPRLKNSASFQAWSYRIMANQALCAARNRPRVVSLNAVAQREIGVDRSEAIDLHDALLSLSPMQRAVVLLRYYAGLSSRDIAAAIGAAPPTVRFHLMRARKQLRKTLSGQSRPQAPADEVLSNAH